MRDTKGDRHHVKTARKERGIREAKKNAVLRAITVLVGFSGCALRSIKTPDNYSHLQRGEVTRKVPAPFTQYEHAATRPHRQQEAPIHAEIGKCRTERIDQL